MPSTELSVLSNPDVQLEALTAQQQLAAAQSQLITNGTQLSNEQLTAQSTLATAVRDSANAARQSVALAALDKKGFSSRMEVDSSADRIREANARVAAARDQVRMLTNRHRPAGRGAETANRPAAGDREFQNPRRFDARGRGRQRSPSRIVVDLGQWVTPGQVLAKVAQPGHLKAVLNVPETQASDVTIGQSYHVDTRNGVVTRGGCAHGAGGAQWYREVDVSLPARSRRGSARPQCRRHDPGRASGQCPLCRTPCVRANNADRRVV